MSGPAQPGGGGRVPGPRPRTVNIRERRAVTSGGSRARIPYKVRTADRTDVGGAVDWARRPDPAALEQITTVEEFARELTAVRERAGLTVRRLQALTGIVHSTLGGYFSGRHSPPVNSLELVLRACGVSDAAELAAWREALLRTRRRPRRRILPAGDPYRGLESFGTDDAQWFFGRDDLTAEIVGSLRARGAGALFVVGPSGSGKSSVLRAGVVPALGAAGVAVEVCTPGAQPLSTLTRRVGALEPPAVLVVDQFEEIFAPDVTTADRAAFVDAVGAARGVVLAGLRADFYPAVLRHAPLAAALRSAQVVVAPMGEAELREAIVGPARHADITIEDGLVELLLRDLHVHENRAVPDSAGALPLLSHALLSTWRRCAGGRMTMEAYRAAGGIDTAVARTAEEAVAALGPEREEMVRQLFLRLVTVAPDVADTRRRLDRDELAGGSDPAGTQAVLEEFVRRRLLVADTGTVEIAHEALLVAWPRLRSWIDADRVGLAVHRRLTDAARAWRDSAGGREGAEDADLLLRGAALAAAVERAEQPAHRDDLTTSERAFLDAGREQDRLRREGIRRQARRARTAVAALSVLLVLAAALSVFAVRQELIAEAARDVAVSRQLAVRADALRGKDPALAAQLAVAAHRVAPTVEARSSLLNATAVPSPTRLAGPDSVTQSVAVAGGLLVSAGGVSPGAQVWSLADPRRPVRLADTPAGAGPAVVVALRGDGRLAATTGADGAVLLVDLADPARPAVLGAPLGDGAGDTILALAFAPDGRTLAAGTAAGLVRRWDLTDSSRPVAAAPVTVSVSPVHSVAFSPDSGLLVAGGADASAYLWPTPDPAPTPAVLAGATGKVFAVAFSPDGSTVALGSADRAVHLWDVTDRALPVRGTVLTGPTNWVNAVAFAPDGATLAAGSSDSVERIWDLRTGRVVTELSHPGPVTATTYLDARTLVTAEAGGMPRIWTVPGPVVSDLGDSVFALGFTADGATLAVGPGSLAGTTSLFDVSAPGGPARRGVPVVNPPGEPRQSGSAALTPDGRTLAVGRSDGSVRLWDVTDPADPRALGGPLIGSTQLVEQLAVSADGRTLAVSGDDNTVRLWDIARPAAAAPLATLEGATSFVLASAFSPDGRLLAAASADRNTYLWDIAAPGSPRLLSTLDGPESYAYAPAFSPDGRTLAVGSADRTVRLWDVTDPARPAALGEPLTGPANYVYSAAFSPDGTTLAAGSTDSTVWLFDVRDRSAPTPSAVLAGPGDAVFSVAYSPDGATLVAGSADETVRLWATDPHRAAEAVCARSGSPVSPAEWKSHVPDLPYAPPCPG